ncbi:MAG: hypothetical protein AAGL17_23855, partial [Cyanobacteria bacterium J06576_12]
RRDGRTERRTTCPSKSNPTRDPGPRYDFLGSRARPYKTKHPNRESRAYSRWKTTDLSSTGMAI